MNEVVSNGYTSNHQALDIVSSDRSSSDIIALESGIVESVVKNVKYTNHNTKGTATYGNYIKIKQNNGKTALYAHMKYGSINANVGDYIQKGTIIGTMGQTGNAYGKHLHLEIRSKNNVKENPIEYLKNKTEEIKKQEEPKEEIKEETTEETKNETEEKNNEQKNNAEEKKITKDEKLEVPETKKIETPKQNNLQKSKPITTSNTKAYLTNNNYTGGSIVDGLKEIHIDSSYSYRKYLAKINGITNYHGSYAQNIHLLKLLKRGQLIKA